MAFPPPTLATNFTNATPQVDAHPAHHNALALAVNDLTAWAKPSGRLVGYVVTSATISTGATVADIPGASIVLPYIANHRYYLKGSVIFQQSVAAGLAYLYITDSLNNQIGAAVVTHNVGEYNAVHVEGFYVPVGAATVKLRFSATSGTVALYQNQWFHAIDYGTP